MFMRIKRVGKRILMIFARFTPMALGKYLSRDHAYIFYSLKFQSLDEDIRNHRYYFRIKGRGFGEDAFHAAWFYVFKKYKPSLALEIGVYRGQTISLWAMLSQKIGHDIQIHGLSPLDDSGDSVSRYVDVRYEEDILSNFRNFNLSNPQLTKDYSNSDTGIKFLSSKAWDLIYIDGSHEYDIVLSDYLHSIDSLKVGGLLVMDDSSLYTKFTRSFPGHPGPSRVLRDHSSHRLRRILSVGHNNFFIKIS
jgi:hypothetical protein